MFNPKNFIIESLRESSKVKLELLNTASEKILETGQLLAERVKKGNKILLCGNGGSAADCQHIATEFIVRLSHDIKRPPIAAIAITTDSSNLTAGGNDIGFENIFSRNVEALGKKDDILIGISTSGNSINIINAFTTARKIGIATIGLLGNTGGKLIDFSDIAVCVPSENVQRIQECHITIGHILCEITERILYGN
jgi:D-sedoheptulose 7-phosphate isomerase